jgi:hypothetical protein
MAGEQFQIYRIEGQCPSNLANSSGWTLMPLVPALAAGYTFTDDAVISGVTYSYDVESFTTRYSGPSNCITRSVT